MSVDGRLLAGEKVYGSIEIGKTSFHATNSRLLRHEHTLLRDRLDDVFYSHISSTSLEHGPNELLLTLGAAVAILSVPLIMLGLFSPFLLSWGIFLIVIGILVIVVAFLYRTSWWQIRAIGLSKEESKRWRLVNANREDAETFVRLIQDQIRPRTIIERQREVNKESLVQREIVKVRCQHCSSLNPETNQSCSNCGAKL